MNYLYIATTTLNFNNIFSTESISPSGFYRKRGFGYKNFEKTHPNNLENHIILYDKYPIFEIQDESRDNYPMIIRIEKSLLAEGSLQSVRKSNQINIFLFNRTIYFHPDKIAIFFRSIQERDTALIRSEGSLTTKTTPFYKKQFFIHEKNSEKDFRWDDSLLEKVDDTSEITSFVKDDQRLDRIKGFAYGYNLGAYKSITPEVALVKHKLQETVNKISSTGSIPEEDISWLSNELESVVEKYKSKYRTNIGTKELFTMRLSKRHIEEFNPKDMPIKVSVKPFTQLINDYCLDCKFLGNLSDSRLETAKNTGIAIKKIVGKAWEGSPYKKYINELLNNIKSANAFDFDSFSNLPIQSVAAFLLKGDNIETLEYFLTIQHPIGNLRLAFAFWGSMYGFSKIPKTLYNVLFEHGEGHASSEHRRLYDILLNSDLNDKTNAPEITKETENNSYKDEVSRKLIEKFGDQIEKWLPVIKDLSKKHSGKITKKFVADFKKKKVKEELGGKLPGINKKKVQGFFENMLEEKEKNDGPYWMDIRSYANSSPTIQQDSKPNTTKTPQLGLNLWFYSQKEYIEKFIEQITPAEIFQKVSNHLKLFKKEWQDPDSECYGWKSKKYPPAIVPAKQRTDQQAIEAFCRELKRNIQKEKENIKYQDFLTSLPKKLKVELDKYNSKNQNG